VPPRRRVGVARGSAVTQAPQPASHDGRRTLEIDLAMDIRALQAGADRLRRIFAERNAVTNTVMDALRHIIVAETANRPLSSGELGERLHVSPGTVTYLVDKMTTADHVLRETDPKDRRRIILRVSDHGRQVAQAFFRPLAAHNHAAMAHLPDEDLAAAHRVLHAMSEAMSGYLDELSQPTGTTDTHTALDPQS
jgi:DNA-binding MarR family transcriptional regulator